MPDAEDRARSVRHSSGGRVALRRRHAIRQSSIFDDPTSSAATVAERHGGKLLHARGDNRFFMCDRHSLPVYRASTPPRTGRPPPPVSRTTTRSGGARSIEENALSRCAPRVCRRIDAPMRAPGSRSRQFDLDAIRHHRRPAAARPAKIAPPSPGREIAHVGADRDVLRQCLSARRRPRRAIRESARRSVRRSPCRRPRPPRSCRRVQSTPGTRSSMAITTDRDKI